MIKILIGSCHELIEQKIIDEVCDYFINTFGLNKNDLFFYSTNGTELGDNLCENYLNKNGFPRELLPPMKTNLRILRECDYAIVFNSHRDTDAGHSNGVAYSLPYLVTNVKYKVVEIHLNCNSISVYECANGCPIEEIAPLTFCYEFDKNGNFKIEKLADRIRRFKKKRMLVAAK